MEAATAGELLDRLFYRLPVGITRSRVSRSLPLQTLGANGEPKSALKPKPYECRLANKYRGLGCLGWP